MWAKPASRVRIPPTPPEQCSEESPANLVLRGFFAPEIKGGGRREREQPVCPAEGGSRRREAELQGLAHRCAAGVGRLEDPLPADRAGGRREAAPAQQAVLRRTDEGHVQRAGLPLRPALLPGQGPVEEGPRAVHPLR